jgi:hypothetical protein
MRRSHHPDFAEFTAITRFASSSIGTSTALNKMQINQLNPELVLRETARFYGILAPSADGWEFVHRTIQDYLGAQSWMDE